MANKSNDKALVDFLNHTLETSFDDQWYPAKSSERAFTTTSGRRFLYCVQHSTGQYKYLDMSTNEFVSEGDMGKVLGF
jgi:hypothetical protein